MILTNTNVCVLKSINNALTSLDITVHNLTENVYMFIDIYYCCNIFISKSLINEYTICFLEEYFTLFLSEYFI